MHTVPLAYYTARTHGLNEEADEIWAATGQPAEEMPAVAEGQLLLPPIPISKVCYRQCPLARESARTHTLTRPLCAQPLHRSTTRTCRPPTTKGRV